jgi:hypothetical protein
VMTLMGQDVWVDVEHLPLYGLWRVWHISCWHEKSPFHSTGSLTAFWLALINTMHITM